MNSLSPNSRGALFMMMGMAGFSVNDAFMKLALESLPLFQSIAIRGAFASVLMALLCAWMKAFDVKGGALKALRHPAVFWRTVGEVGSTILFLSALARMPIANATAVLQVLPLAITLAAAWFLGEQVGWRRYLAIAIGFLGVMLILRPGTDGFDAYSLYAVGAVVFIVLRDLSTRSFPPELPSSLVTFLTAIVITILGCLGMPFESVRAPTTTELGLLAAAAAILMVGYAGTILAMRNGDVSFVTPFRYSILIFALLLGWLVFDSIPDGLALTGAVIVVASGLFTFYRERRLARNAAMSAASASASARNHA